MLLGSGCSCFFLLSSFGYLPGRKTSVSLVSQGWICDTIDTYQIQAGSASDHLPTKGEPGGVIHPPNVLCNKKWSVDRPFQFQNLSLHLASIELLDFLSRGCYFLGTTMLGRSGHMVPCFGSGIEDLNNYSLFLGKEETI